MAIALSHWSRGGVLDVEIAEAVVEPGELMQIIHAALLSAMDAIHLSKIGKLTPCGFLNEVSRLHPWRTCLGPQEQRKAARSRRPSRPRCRRPRQSRNLSDSVTSRMPLIPHGMQTVTSGLPCRLVHVHEAGLRRYKPLSHRSQHAPRVVRASCGMSLITAHRDPLANPFPFEWPLPAAIHRCLANAKDRIGDQPKSEPSAHSQGEFHRPRFGRRLAASR